MKREVSANLMCIVPGPVNRSANDVINEVQQAEANNHIVDALSKEKLGMKNFPGIFKGLEK